jgi:hypothetical protein
MNPENKVNRRTDIYYDLLGIIISDHKNDDVFNVLMTKPIDSASKMVDCKFDYYCDQNNPVSDIINYGFYILEGLAQGNYSYFNNINGVTRENELDQFSKLYDDLYFISVLYTKAKENKESQFTFSFFMNDLVKKCGNDTTEVYHKRAMFDNDPTVYYGDLANNKSHQEEIKEKIIAIETKELFLLDTLHRVCEKERLRQNEEITNVTTK